MNKKSYGVLVLLCIAMIALFIIAFAARPPYLFSIFQGEEFDTEGVFLHSYHIVEPLNGKPAKRMMVVLHGASNSSQEMLPFARLWGPYFPDTVFVFPNGVLSDIDGSYKWYKRHENSMDVDVTGVYQAGHAMLGFIHVMQERYRVSPEDTGVVGFSQGGSVALQVAMGAPDKLWGVASYAGILFAESEEKRKSAQTLSVNERFENLDIPDFQTPVLLVQGSKDKVIAPQHFEFARDALLAHKRDVSTALIKGLDHDMNGKSLQYGIDFFTKTRK